MASSPITSWEIDGETVETVSDFIFLGSKITTDGDCSHEIITLGSFSGELQAGLKKQASFQPKQVHTQPLWTREALTVTRLTRAGAAPGAGAASLPQPDAGPQPSPPLQSCFFLQLPQL